MKIGILTFHRAHNYGAVLQCYALQEVLRGLGYEVWIIDYRQPHIERQYKILRWDSFCQILLHPSRSLSYSKGVVAGLFRTPIFAHFRKKYLLTTQCYRSCENLGDFDIYLIGSDQVWGLHCTNGLDKVYFGDFKHPAKSKVMGYAVSTNSNSLDQIGSGALKKYVTNFSTLSFREAAMCQRVAEMTGMQGQIDVDPTLVADIFLWDSLVNEKWRKQKYVLFYQVRGPIGDSRYLKRKAKEFAARLNCKLIDLSSGIYSVEDFVSLFKYASYIITSSFHGTVFSLIFEKPFYTYKLQDGQDQRCKNLLDAIGAQEMLVNLDFIPVVRTTDYTHITEKFKELRKESLNYLNTL